MLDKVKIAEKFSDVCVDEDVGLLMVQFDQIDNVDCRLEMWCADNVLAHSAIFLTDELPSSIMNEEDAIEWFQKSTGFDKVTYKVSSQFTFINYGFSVAEGMNITGEPDFKKSAREKFVLKKALE